MKTPLYSVLFFIFFSLYNKTQAADLPPGFAEVLVAQGLDPTAMALAPDGRLFLTEKYGAIRIVDNGQLLQDPFLVLDVDNYNERGLEGIAIDPDFMHNQYVYIYYTVKNQNHNRVSRFTANGNYAIPGSEVVLLNLNQLSGEIHNGGAMAFGPDGKLYISTGDGGDGGNAQSFTSLLGKILRINPDGSIPNDNPFFNQTTGDYRAIYALGVRNAFSMTIQPVTGRIFTTDVGNATWEEINEILPGQNYGWPIIEGPIHGQTPPDNYKEPVYYYNHTSGCAAVGAAFYNPAISLFPNTYKGKFFFADYCRGYIKYLDPDSPTEINNFAFNINRPLNLLVAPDGTMYYLSRAGIGGGSAQDNTASENGTLWRIFYTGSNKPFISVNPQSILVSQGEDAEFSIVASGDEPLSYQWQKNRVDIIGAMDAEFTFPNTMLADSGVLIRCIVTNALGADTSTEAQLRVTQSQRPEPEILTPVINSTYRAGDLLSFSGRATDPEEGELSPNDLRWKIDFHHHTHTHPALVPTAGISEGEYLIPSVGETSDDVWYKIHLTVTDESGLSKTVTRDVFPEKTQFIVKTIPDSLPVYVESDFLKAPVSITSVVGINREIEVLSFVREGDSIHIFKQWSDGYTGLSRIFAASPDTITYTALYDTYPVGNGTGIRGYYYDGINNDPTFYEPYKFTWIDTTVNYDWGNGSPAETQLGIDYWLVRWEGFVEPYLDDVYTFYINTDDGSRVWIDDQLIIDAWWIQGETLHGGSIALEAGRLYPVKIEYFESAGGAVCEFSWSSSRISRSIVPRSQLYPESSSTSIDDVGKIRHKIILYPNPVEDILNVQFASASEHIKEIRIDNMLGEVIMTLNENLKGSLMVVNVRHLPPGMYWMEAIFDDGIRQIVGFVKG